MNAIARTAALCLVAALAPACGVDHADPDVATTADELWQIDAEYYADGWAATDPHSSSGWDSVRCRDYGYSTTADTAHLVTALTAWRERASNLDNFVARVVVDCGEYDENQTAHRLEQTGSVQDELLYSGGYREVSGTSAVIDAELPIGVRLAVNAGGAYVKDLALLTGTTTWSNASLRWLVAGYSSPTSAGWALSNVSNTTVEDVMCPDQMVLSRIDSRNDTRNGKLTYVQLYCIEIGDVPTVPRR